MAKRSVKRARRQDDTERAAARPPAAPGNGGAGASRRSFWLGAVAAAALLVPAGVAATVVASRDEADPAAAERTERAAIDREIESEAEALRRQTQVRDRRQVRELTERMTRMVGELAPVVDGLAKTFPPGTERVRSLARERDVQKWRRTVRAADAYFENPPSGETGTNIARGGFAAAVDALLGATETYALALEAPAGRDALLERVRDQRDVAVRAWSVAATQLDAINIATGHGHQHVYLGGAEAAGGFGADGVPEGTGAEDPGAGAPAPGE